MALRDLSKEERDQARYKALAARTERAEVKQRFASGILSFEDVLSLAESSNAVARMKTIDLLEALNGVGKIRASKVLEDLEIAESRRLAGLGSKQRAVLGDYLAQLRR